MDKFYVCKCFYPSG